MPSINAKSSYTAADSIPIKVLQNWNLVRRIVDERYIYPEHIQLCPTNICTRNCSFCSCSKRDKKEELSFDRVDYLARKMRRLGCRSVTITGGGEPLCHPRIADIIKKFSFYGIKIGLVTNGDLINTIPNKIFRLVTWCRVSCSDEVKFNIKWAGRISRQVNECNIDWAFSYVVSKEPNIGNINRHLEFASLHNFTHVRIVSDLLDYKNVPYLEGEFLNNPLVLYQTRKAPRKPTEKCLISLFKPLFAANENIYPCCGVQYAEMVPSENFGNTMIMGSIDEIGDIWKNQKYFSDWEQCEYCYYTEYNDILNKMLLELNHREFG